MSLSRPRTDKFQLKNFLQAGSSDVSIPNISDEGIMIGKSINDVVGLNYPETKSHPKLTFNDCEFHDIVDFSEYKKTSELVFINCRFYQTVNFDKVSRRIKFSSGCVFHKNVSLRFLSPPSHIEIDNCTFYSRLRSSHF